MEEAQDKEEIAAQGRGQAKRQAKSSQCVLLNGLQAEDGFCVLFHDTR